MPDDTDILSLPLILPAQAQKHVTHNEALVALDVLVQLAVINRDQTVPPALPAIGDRHIVPAAATLGWAGQTGKIAVFTASGWQFHSPLAGWQARVLAEAETAVFDGLIWKVPSEAAGQFLQLGVSATPDATNRLSVSSPATLLNHAGAGHQLKLNKASATDTASLMFQTGFSGRAEMGTAGSDSFSIKVSANGSAWNTAMSVAPATGQVTLPVPLFLGGQSSDPVSPPNGTVWLNTTTGEVKVRSNGASVIIAAGGGGGVADGDKGDVVVASAGTVWTVDANAVSNAKLADMAAGTLKGNNAGSAGDPVDLTAAQAKTLLAIAAADVSGLGTMAGQSAAAVAITGGTVTVNSGGLALRDADQSHAMTVQLSSNLTAARTLTLDPGDASRSLTLTGDATLSGTNTGDQTITLTGDVTGSGTGSFAATVAAGAITNAQLSSMASDRLKGRTTPGTGTPEDLTAEEVREILGLQAPGLTDFWEVGRFGSASTQVGMFAGAAVSAGTNSATIPAAAILGYNPFGVFLRSSTTANGGYRYLTSNQADRFGVQSRKFVGRCLWRNFTGVTVRIGFHNATIVADATNGAYFEIVGAVISCKTATGGVRTTAATTFTAALTELYSFDIEVDAAGTSARFRVWQGQSVTPVLDTTVTTTIPTAQANAFGCGVVATEVSVTATDMIILYDMSFGTIEGYARVLG